MRIRSEEFLCLPPFVTLKSGCSCTSDFFTDVMVIEPDDEKSMSPVISARNMNEK